MAALTAGAGTAHGALTYDEIAAEALILLENELIATRCVDTSLTKYFSASKNGFKEGDTVTVPITPRQKSATGRTLVKQPLVDKFTTMTVDTQRHWGVSQHMIDLALNMADFRERFLAPAMSDIAHQVDLDILTKMTQGFYHTSGTPGTAVNYTAIDKAGALMTTNAIPKDGMRSCLVDPLDAHNLRVALSAVGASARLQESAIESATLGRIGGMPVMESAQAYHHTVGARGGTPLVAGGSQSGKTLDIDGLSNSVTGWGLKGDVFTIAGVYAVNQANRQSTGQLQQFVLTADVASSGTGTATLSFEPEINSGAQSFTNDNGDTVSTAAYQTVTALPADNAAVTFVGTAGATYRQALAFHKSATAFCAVPIPMPKGAVIKARKTSGKSGLTVLITGGYDTETMEDIARLDILYGVKVLDPRLGHRIWGEAI